MIYINHWISQATSDARRDDLAYRTYEASCLKLISKKLRTDNTGPSGFEQCFFRQVSIISPASRSSKAVPKLGASSAAFNGGSRTHSALYRHPPKSKCCVLRGGLRWGPVGRDHMESRPLDRNVHRDPWTTWMTHTV